GTGNSMTIDQSGEYYFEWTNDALNGVCTTTSPTITINISESIEDMPVVTVVSGDLNFCEGEGEVVLEAPEGFAYYKWSTGETTRSITREVAGTVTVQVSNVPFDAGCASPSSAPIVIETSNLPDFVVSTDNSNPQPDDYLFDGAQYSECDDFRLYFYDLDASTSPRNDNGEVVINRGGDFYASTQNTSYLFEESGEYSIEWVSSDLSSTCSASGGSFSLTITESIETAPTISTTDDLTFCEGSTATLTAEAGFNFYRWYNGTSVINTNSSTLVVDSSGDYTVEVSNTPFTVGCGSPRSNGIRVTVYNDPNMNLETNISGSALSDGEVIDVCSDDGFVLRADNTGGNPVTWYLDGVALPGSSNNTGNTSRSDYEPTVSGVYFAEVTVGGSDVADQCVYRTPSVTVNVSQKLDVASIATPANTTFCEGEVDVTLTATGPADASVFRWYRSNVNSSSFSAITDGTGNGNTIQVTGEGKYYVTVGETDGCESDPSNVITIESQTLANPNISVTTFDANCSNGGVTVQLSSTNAETVYQLINQETGANVGSPKTGSTSDPVYVQLTGVTESFGVLVQASYADGTGCPQTSTGSRGTVTPDNVMLELDGNELVAVINGSFIDYTWFRDGVELKNVTGTSLRITDASVYSIEVVFVGGCSVTSNSIDLTNESAGAGGGAGGIQGSAYPNPASGVVNVAIEGENMGDYDISIMTLSGQLMMSKTLSKEDEDFVEQLDIQSLQPGIYNLLIRKGNETKSMRIVKTQ
ncbi:MAG: T9SS type A sorting domain-containing protein, partial [Ekhidna sp.]